jgi:PEP-CTERM motif
MKSNAFLSGPTVALGLALTLFGAPARADLVFDWSGSCVTGCPAGQGVSAELDLDQDYVFGTPITDNNFVDLTFKSSTLNQIITTLDNPATGIKSDGSLVTGAINFQDGAKVFAFQVSSAGGLNWFATSDSLTLRGLGASKFTSASVLSTPEPSTWVMMMLGFAGLSYAGCRPTRRRAAAAA